MANVRQIMELLSVDKDTAFRIYDVMDIDFSECTNREFESAARSAYDYLSGRM